jgi:hypothetical protein
MMDDQYTVRARELIQEKLLNHEDEGVRAIAALCDPPEDAVARVAEKLRLDDEIEALRTMPDSEIDTSDIPEITDVRNPVRGKYYRKPH